MIIERYPNELPGVKYNLVVIKPSKIELGMKYSLVIVLVGITAKGDNLPALEADIPPNVKLAADTDDMIMVAVQTPDTYNDEILFALDWSYKNLPVVRAEGTYGYGFSYGGGGLWNFACASLEQAKMFDAIVPVATTWTSIPENGWKNVAESNIRIWAFHNKGDNNGGTPVAATNSYVDSVNSLRPGAATKTIFAASGHGGWNEAAATDKPPYAVNGEGLTSPQLTIWKWLKANRGTARISPPANLPSAAGVVAKGTATIEGGLIKLDGEASTGYDSISWTDVSAIKSIWVGGTGWRTAVSKPTQSGTYRFILRATKNTATGPAVAEQIISVDFQMPTQPLPTDPFKPTHIIRRPDGTYESVRIETL